MIACTQQHKSDRDVCTIKEKRARERKRERESKNINENRQKKKKNTRRKRRTERGNSTKEGRTRRTRESARKGNFIPMRPRNAMVECVGSGHSHRYTKTHMDAKNNIGQ